MQSANIEDDETGWPTGSSADDGATKGPGPAATPYCATADVSGPLPRIILRHIFSLRVSALMLLAFGVVTSMIQTGTVAVRLAADTAMISLSGQQRMLSQRIVYLAQDVVLQGRAADGYQHEARPVVVDDLGEAIALFEVSHEMLVDGTTTDPALRRLLFSDTDGSSLDRRTGLFIATARAVLENQVDREGLQTLKDLERDGLLSGLDTLVAAVEAGSLGRIETLRNLGLLVQILAVAIVATECAFSCLPGNAAMRRTVRSLTARNDALVETRQMLLASIEDLTSHRLEIEAAVDVTAAALAESEALRREQTQFTFAVSHDLKSPANTMQLLLNEIRHDNYDRLDADGRDLLDSALGTVRRMGDLVDDVLTYSWLTNADADPETFDMGVCIREVIADLAADIRTADAQVFCGPGSMVTGHRSQLRVLVQNLIANAIKFCPADTAPDVRVNCRKVDGDGTWRLIVKDNGIGIAPEHQSRIFESFKRLHGREVYPGTGLGLATCRRVVANHLGGITLRSEPGVGSTFDITLRPPKCSPVTASPAGNWSGDPPTTSGRLRPAKASATPPDAAAA